MVTTWWVLKPKHMAKILTRIIQAVIKVLILYYPITYFLNIAQKDVLIKILYHFSRKDNTRMCQ